MPETKRQPNITRVPRGTRRVALCEEYVLPEQDVAVSVVGAEFFRSRRLHDHVRLQVGCGSEIGCRWPPQRPGASVSCCLRCLHCLGRSGWSIDKTMIWRARQVRFFVYRVEARQGWVG